MKMNASRKWLRLIGGYLLCFTVMLSLLCLSVHVNAQENAVQLDSWYPIGEAISIPEKQFDADGGGVTAAATIRTPSGKVYRVQDTFTPTEDGLHTLSYIAIDKSGSVHTEEHSFIVSTALYSVGTSRSSVSFGRYAYGSYVIDRKAVLAAIASTDKFSYTEIIDLKELDGESFLEFFVTPENIGTNDVGKIEVILTDIYNPDNFVTIAIKKGTAGEVGAAWAERNSYITGNAANQVPTGMEKGKGTMEIDGMMYQLHKGNVWGANVLFALPGNPTYVSLEKPNNLPQTVGTQTLALSMDYDAKTIYANGQLVTMLTSENIYGTDIWEGFTTGECLLTIQGTNYNASALNMAITKLGKNKADVGTILTENRFMDTQAPVITVDVQTDPDTDTCPNAVVGQAYPLFAAAVKDDYSSDAAVNTAVYFNYGTEREVQVDVSNGSFVPFRAGTYTIVYTSADHYGNVGTVSLEITAEDAGAPRLEAVVEDLEKGSTGETYTLNTPSFSNSRGIVSWEAVATHESGKAEYRISSEDPTFFPEYAGSYQVVYHYNDYVYTESLTKTLVVETNDEPIRFEDPVLPKYLIYGCIYELPEIDVRVYSSGEPVAARPEIWVIEDGGTEKKADYRFVTYAKETVQIIYRVENNGKTMEFRSEVLPVKDVGYNGTYQIGKYFDCTGMSVDSQPKYIRFTPVSGEDQASAAFINGLQTFDFSIRFAATGRGFERINLYLTDYTDSSVVVKFSYRQVNGAVYFNINDGQEVQLADTSFNNPDLPLNLNVTDNGITVMPTGTTALAYTVYTDLAGNTFNGFAGSSAYLTVELEGISNYKQAGVDIFNISGQTISGIYVDNIKPAISATTASGARPFGSEFVIEPVYFGDVLDPVADCLMYVKAPDGSYAVTKDGEVLDESAQSDARYTLELNQYGNYTVSYEVTDVSGNKLTFSYVINSADVTPPAVNILSPVQQGTVQTKIPVAGIRIFDNCDKQLENFVVYVYVLTPHGQSYAVMDSAGQQAGYFTATHAGVYTVNYMVIDSSGNLTLASYEVNVQ